MKKKNSFAGLDRTLFEKIKSILLNSRAAVVQNINRELILTYWRIGKEIADSERKNVIDAQTSRQVILTLSKKLTEELGKGFSRSNLFNMRKFYLEHPDVQTVSGHLSWSHLCELLIIEDRDKRGFYQNEAIRNGWSLREMSRQIDSSLFERLLLAGTKANQQKVFRLAKDGHTISTPEDLLRNPYVFEFLGLSDEKPVLERDLENKLIFHLESFLLELGKGFMFVGRQQRITINNTHFYVDMVFYNKPLRCYIIIELKTTKLNIGDAGQLNTYLNFYKTEVNDPDDNPPIGIILCTDKDEITAEYILGGFENKVMAARYTTILPDRELLISELETALESGTEI